MNQVKDFVKRVNIVVQSISTDSNILYVFGMKFNHQTHGTTSYFLLSKNSGNQYEKVNEANIICNQKAKFEEGESP